VSEVLYWIGMLIDVYVVIMFARVIMGLVLSFTQYRPSGAAAVAFELVYTLTDPPTRFLRRFVPDLRLGNVSLDLSFILLLIALQILARELKSF
jgi:YggT family protein